MKIRLDENMPAGLAAVLSDLGHDATTVPDEGLGGRDDTSIWQAAQRGARFLITQDLDFSDTRRFRPGTHYGLLLVRVRKPRRVALTEAVRTAFETEDVSTWAGCFAVLGEHKLRVRRPPH
jgi:predicted nuclease of predicted toxin-antitoxin system